MEIVDPPLQRDGELDQVLSPATEQHPLRIAHAPHPDPGDPGKREARHGHHRADDGDQTRHVRRHVHRRYPPGSEKMTGYVAVLFARFTSPGTPFTSTVRLTCLPNETAPRLPKVTTCCSPGLIVTIVSCSTIGGGPVIVSDTGIFTSCESPESSTVTAISRSVPVVTVFSDPSVRTCFAGNASTETMFVPWIPVTVPPVVAPLIRCNTSAIWCAETKSALETECDSGGITPVTPSAFTWFAAGVKKRSSQTMSLASSRSP